MPIEKQGCHPQEDFVSRAKGGDSPRPTRDRGTASKLSRMTQLRQMPAQYFVQPESGPPNYKKLIDNCNPPSGVAGKEYTETTI